MEKCSEYCYAICDFCANYDFNPGPSGEYVDNGFCRLLEMKKDPCDVCEDFKCFNIKAKI